MGKYYIEYVVTYKDSEDQSICTDTFSDIVPGKSEKDAKKKLKLDKQEEYSEEFISIDFADCYLTSNDARL